MDLLAQCERDFLERLEHEIADLQERLAVKHGELSGVLRLIAIRRKEEAEAEADGEG